MTTPYTLSFTDKGANLASVGGKGASLARLAAAGLAVPGGFYVTTSAYDHFVAANKLQPAILEALKTVDTSNPSNLEVVSQKIRQFFLNGEITEDLAGQIISAYAELAGDDTIVAIRSSATAEDLPDLSFAGQQDTFLNIQGSEDVLDAIRRCWASLWTARAIGYRLQNNIDQALVKLAVVVQSMVFSEASGILFTANPLNGHRDQLMINAAWGLGEAVVGGLVTPDTIIVDKTDGRILSHEIADKRVMTVRTVNDSGEMTGTQEQDVPGDIRQQPTLTGDQVDELSRLGIRIEAMYAMPMDIEWGLAGGNISILQARPITVLPEPEPELPTEWVMPFKGRAMRNNIVELMMAPLTPLFRTFGREAINTSMVSSMATFLGADILTGELIITVNDYAYYGAQFTAKQIMKILFMSPKIMKTMLTAPVARWVDDGRPHYFGVVERWKATNWKGFSNVDLLDAARELTEEAINAYISMVAGVIPAAWMTEALFTRTYDLLMKGKDGPDAPTYLLGYDSTPIKSEKSLFDLAAWAGAHDRLKVYLTTAAIDDLAETIFEDQVPEGVDEVVWREWQGRFDAHIQQFGHAIYNLDFSSPTPADAPQPLLEVIQLYLNGQGADPHTRQKVSAERRENAEKAMLGKLKGLRLKMFRKFLGWAQRFAPLREDCLADVGLSYPLLRQVLRELGRRFAQAGMFEEADDIFWLEGDEARQAVAALDRGETLPSCTGQVAERKAYWHALHRLIPPVMLPQMKIFGRDVEGIMAGRSGKEGANVLKGVAASPGKVTAPACVLTGPEDFSKMEDGDVLVASITTPAWTPLFARASAVITDVGGPLSHGSIVAREYGIPAVLGTAEATRRIKSGDTITVDGSEGKVYLNVS